MRRVRLTVFALLALLAIAAPALAAPEGQMTWGVHVSLAPTWFEPAETQGIITPFMVMYAIHDALAKAMPGNPVAPSLAESWQMSADGRVYDFTLRKGVKFHNGDTLTSEDVKFSFERYKGASAKAIKDRVAAVETPGPLQVRFRLKNPWPDFMTFYTAASGAGWIVPKKYVEKVGDEAYKKAPVGAGPYRFVSFTPGIELVMEAFVVAGGQYVYGSYPDIDALFKDQAAELDRKKREALLHKIQQLMHEKVMHIPIWELAFINGQGARVQESGLGLIPGHAYSAPYEDVKLKPK